MAQPKLMTIGYEGKTIQALIDSLLSEGVRRVVDVRELPLSRRRGFSKTPLARALAVAGVEYVHVRDAGNPFRHDSVPTDEVLKRYRRHMSNCRGTLSRLLEVVNSSPSALLCLEADPARCHRSVLANLLARKADRLRISDL